MGNRELKYKETQAEKRTAKYRDPYDADLMATQHRKSFITAALYMGTAVGLLVVQLIFPDIEGTVQDTEVLKVFSGIAWALIASSAVLILSLKYAQGLTKTLMFILNWLVLPAVLVDGLMKLADVFFEGMPQV